jgi:hypothetical protein
MNFEKKDSFGELGERWRLRHKLSVALIPEHSSRIHPLRSSSESGAMAEPQQNLVGPQVRRIRLAAGLSQAALTAKLQIAGWDISRGGVSKIESRLRLVNDAEVFLLAKVLQCSLVDLFPTKVSAIKGVLRQGKGE